MTSYVAPNGRPSKLLKISLFLRKLPNITDDQFRAHWKGQHVNVAMDSATFRKKVRKYNQYHLSPQDRADAATFGIPVLEYDGVAEVWVDSLEDWREIVNDKEFVATIPPDEDYFLAKPIHVVFGHDNLVIPENEGNEDGKDLRLRGQ